MPNNEPIKLVTTDTLDRFKTDMESNSGNGGGSVNIATSTTVGTVKPDNSTITVADDGTLSANKNIDILSTDPTNPTAGQMWVTISS